MGCFKLPDRNAAAVRVAAVGDALTAAGYRVTFIGEEDHANTGGGRLGNAFDYLVTSSSYIAKIGTANWSQLAAVIYYPGSAALMIRLMRLCRKHGIPLVVDCVEWYDPRHTPGGQFGPFALDSEWRMRYLHKRAGNVIGISSFLTKYYGDRGCHVVRVPPLIGAKRDLDESQPLASAGGPENSVRLVYAGFPGKKELFNAILLGLQVARKRGIDVSLDLVGIAKSELPAIANPHDAGPEIYDGVICHGRLPRESALRVVVAADFTVLLRPQERFANAGFPSKLVESLSLGVPVIANATSDIAEFVRDRHEGYVLSEPTASALEVAIARAATLTAVERAAMRRQARLRAEECFDYRKYAQILKEFISSARTCTW